MDVDCIWFGGSGTFADWIVNLSGQPGSSGTSGVSGTMGSSGTSGTSGSSGTCGTSISNLQMSSATSNNVTGTGTYSWTLNDNAIYALLSRVRIINNNNIAQYCEGRINIIAGTLITVGVDNVVGNPNSSSWLVGLTADGTSGTSGNSGSSGTTGSSGTSGANGSSGTSGENGSSGTSGNTGSSGTSGENGSSGTSGNTGVVWSSIPGSSGAAGAAGELAYDANSLYVCVSANSWATASLVAIW